MRILFLTRRFYPLAGGVEKHSYEVAKRLVKLGHEVNVITEGENFSTNEYDGIIVHQLLSKYSGRLKKFEIWFRLLGKKKIIENSDIVHCHDVFFWYIPFRFLYPVKKVFVTFHGWEGVFPPRLSAKIVRKLSEKLSFGNICIGDYILKWYKTNPDIVSYGAVSKKACRKKINADVLFIGRLEKDTGLMIYLEVLKKFKEDIKIIFLGDGILRKEAEKYGDVLGFVENVQEYIKGSRLVFTSGYLSILESFINKKPVFSVYDNPLKKDYLEKTPFQDWIVIEEDPVSLFEKVRYYLKTNSASKKKVEFAYNWAKNQTWEKLTRQYLELWKK
ncbi:MAG: glycosyltransferase family 4 protein [Patescibacteria group bacterium]|jgi:glycosyltransferase involved in cell wall biosynthesis